jgi:Tfp pilus assembly protein PilF
MRCYKCGATLSENDFCNSCGADVALYKKIIKMSNMYYNIGLEKAKVRDLSGAIDYLRRSIHLYKKNISARNLLGLVYYEMGDVVEALSEWVISKNLQSDKNIADDYIGAVQNNQSRLDTINQTIKKYNMALSYAGQGSDDLAVIQLKKVLTLNPNLIKGHQLLALLYMKNNEYEKIGRAHV